MKKRFLSVITLFAMTLFAGCGSSAPESAPSSETISATVSVPEESKDTVSVPESERFEVNPPFFKVENKETGAVVYMLGSMHVGKAGATYPDKMYKALDECETLAVEVDILALESDIAAATEATMIMLCEQGKTVRDYLGDDYDFIMGKFREKGLYSKLYESYIPALWSSMWASAAAAECGYDVNAGTDRLLLAYAKEHGKTVEEIESAKEQYQMEADNSPAMATYLLKATVELSAEETREQFDMLYDSWKSGNIAALKGLAEEEDEELPTELKSDYEKYYDAMYTHRQEKMASYVKSKLKSGGKTFVVVGAMHYAAPPSIIDILTENGYTVETL